MFETHVTREGEGMLIAQMDDQHLENFIAMYLATAIEGRKAIVEEPSDDFTKALYGIKDMTPEIAAHATRKAVTKLYPYLSEAYLRGLEIPRDMLQQALGRATRLEVATNLPLLAEKRGLQYYMENAYGPTPE